MYELPTNWDNCFSQLEFSKYPRKYYLPFLSNSAPDPPSFEEIILRVEQHFLLVLKVLGHSTLTHEHTKPSGSTVTEVGQDQDGLAVIVFHYPLVVSQQLGVKGKRMVRG